MNLSASKHTSKHQRYAPHREHRRPKMMTTILLQHHTKSLPPLSKVQEEEQPTLTTISSPPPEPTPSNQTNVYITNTYSGKHIYTWQWDYITTIFESDEEIATYSTSNL
jgi:hypothetical protein